MNDTTSSSILSFFDDDERFNHLIGVLIALVTVLTAAVAFLQSDAGARSDQAKRNAYQFAIQGMGQQFSGQARVNYDWNNAFQTWSQLDLLAWSAESLGDDTAAKRYRIVRDRIAELSPMLAAPYFDSSAEEPYPDIAGYESDTYYVETTALTEQFSAASNLDNAWGDKENSYVAQLTILAVALFLYGLSTTVSGLPRQLFVIVGTIIVIITIIWTGVVFSRPLPHLPAEAVTAYANGVGLAYRGKPAEAIVAFDQALAAAPDYANAFFDRANARYDMGDYQAAVVDYEAARTAGREDINVVWNLSWQYYLLGRFDDAIRTGNRALELDSNHLWARLDLGLALLAAGQTEAAQKEYMAAMDLAARQVAEAEAAGQEPPAFLWDTLDGAALELDSLWDQAEEIEPLGEAPPREAIVNAEAVKTAAPVLIDRLKSFAVALEYTGQPPAGQLTAKLSPLEFGQYVYDEEGNEVLDAEGNPEYIVSDTFPYGANEVLVWFDYEGMRDGQEVVYKVYVDGQEVPSFRFVEKWSLGASGSAEVPLSFAYSNVYVFDPGVWSVEIYVDSHLAQRDWFTIEPYE